MFYILFCLLINISNCSTESLNGTCFNKTISKRYCCTDFEDSNGICVPCKIGYQSFRGQSCVPCDGGYYGNRCVMQCDCTSTVYSCHHIHGCVKKQDTTVTTVTTSSTLKARITTVIYHTTKDTTDVTTVDSAVDITIQSTGSLIFDWKIYSAAVATLVLILWITNVCYKHMTRKRKRLAIASINNNPENKDRASDHRGDLENQEQKIYEYEGEEYDLIDESKLVDMTVKNDVYLEVIDSSTSDSSSSLNEDKDGYITPCKEMKITATIHQSSSCNAIYTTEDANGYLNPYNGLIPVENIHTYEGCSTKTNVEVEDYLHPYNTLLATEDTHIYDGTNKLKHDNITCENKSIAVHSLNRQPNSESKPDTVSMNSIEDNNQCDTAILDDCQYLDAISSNKTDTGVDMYLSPCIRLPIEQKINTASENRVKELSVNPERENVE